LRLLLGYLKTAQKCVLRRCVLDRLFNDPILPQPAAFLTLAKTLSGKLAFAEVTASLDSLDDHLAYRTFLVGHTLTAADAAVWGSLRGAAMYNAPRSRYEPDANILF